MSKSFEIKGYINNVLKEIGLEGADAFDKALLLNALGKLEAAEHSDEYKEERNEEEIPIFSIRDHMVHFSLPLWSFFDG